MPAPPKSPASEPTERRVRAPFGRRLVQITQSRKVGAYRVLHATDTGGPAPAAGQFAMLASVDGWGGGEDERPYLPRAFSYARFLDAEAQFLLEDVGPGTHRLAELAPGDEAWLLGPLGVGFSAPSDGRRALLVGGGVGIAPLMIWQDTLLEQGTPQVALLGFRDRARAQAAGLLRDARVASDDGSVGHHGLVLDLLERELSEDAHAVVYACGPSAMLEAVRAACARRKLPAQLALEAGMACGFGACFGCVIHSSDGYLRVCLDGPVIDAQRLERVDQHTDRSQIGQPA